MKNKFDYKYRIIQYSWGIAIDLIGYISKLPYQKEQIICELSSEIDTLHQIYMQKGIQFFHEHVYDDKKIDYSITFEKICYNPCDFQNEGLIVATVECLSQISSIPLPQIEVNFNRLTNQYEFQYNSIAII